MKSRKNIQISRSIVRPKLQSRTNKVAQKTSAKTVKRWMDLSFKVTERESRAFKIQAAHRGTSHKALFLAAVEYYCRAFPVAGLRFP